VMLAVNCGQGPGPGGEVCSGIRGSVLFSLMAHSTAHLMLHCLIETSHSLSLLFSSHFAYEDAEIQLNQAI
jgi:hypothetical protein